MLDLKNKFITKNKSTRIYEVETPIIALTGGIATGKSTVSNILNRKYKIPIICADSLVKSIYKQEESFQFIKNIAPSSIKKDQIDFSYLKKLFFTNKELKTNIESYIYKKLKSEFLKEFNKKDQSGFLIYDIPLLFEKKLSHLFDQVVCVYADNQTQQNRLIKRDQISSELATDILSSQLQIEEKRKLSNFIIDNSKTLDFTHIQIKSFINTITL